MHKPLPSSPKKLQCNYYTCISKAIQTNHLRKTLFSHLPSKKKRPAPPAMFRVAVEAYRQWLVNLPPPGHLPRYTPEIAGFNSRPY